MTDSEHAALSAELARALGWHLAANRCGKVFVRLGDNKLPMRRFDYRDPTVCLPLIEWLMREHFAWLNYRYDNLAYKSFFIVGGVGPKNVIGTSYNSIAEAVARAVIAVIAVKKRRTE